MKSKFFAAAAVATLFCSFANAGQITQTASMSVSASSYSFQNVDEVTLTLNTTEAAPESVLGTMTLSYITEFMGPATTPRVREVSLEIVSQETDTCGTVHYFAHLPQAADSTPSRNVGHRFSVHLQDHSARTCEDYRPYMWEAEVREGYGWCGTGDSTMSLSGNPVQEN